MSKWLSNFLGRSAQEAESKDADVSSDMEDGTDEGLKLESREGAPANRTTRGLNLLADPQDAAIDIYALHGLGGDAYETWTFKNNGSDTMWLQDTNMLPAMIPFARIFTYGYDANVALNTSVADLRDYALTFLNFVSLSRSTVKQSERPIILIGHSLGGLVIKQALILSKPDRGFENISNNVRGVLFMGTPHQGSATATWGLLFSHIASLVVRPNKGLLRLLEKKSPKLHDVTFEWKNVYDRLQIVSCYERMSTQLKVQRLSTVIVDRESAILNLSNEKQVPMEADHLGICKFFGPNDPNFFLVAGHLKIMAQTLSKTIGRKLSEFERSCLRAFATSDYNTYRASIPSPVNKTCTWFLQHRKFLKWIEEPVSSLLWVSGGPGCGKTVMASFLIDELHARIIQANLSATLCYFFCDDKNDAQRSATAILCATLHQLMSSNPSLVKHAINPFTTKGHQLTNELRTLWDILMVTHADPSCGHIILIVDALDECEEGTRLLFLEWVVKFVKERKPAQNHFKILMTSRPEFSIARKVDLPEVRLKAEDEIKHIEHDIRLVVSEKLQALDYSDDITKMLAEGLMSKADGTFLWVALMLRLLEDCGNSSEEGLRKVLDGPTSGRDLFDVYSRILDCIPLELKTEAKKILQITVTAYRPLELVEFNMALGIRSTDTSEDDVRPRLQKDLQLYLLRCCGPFLRIVNSTVQLVHQTAKEFLLSSTDLVPNFWLLEPTESHLLLAHICMWYLLFQNFEKHPSFISSRESKNKRRRLIERYSVRYTFLTYSAMHWCAHFRESQVQAEEDTVYKASELLDTRTPRSSTWFQIHRSKLTYRIHPAGFHGLLAASYYGHQTVVKLLLARSDVDPDSRDSFARTPLSWAAENGHDAVVRLLLARSDVDPDSRDRSYQTPLSRAASNGHEAVVRLLLTRMDVDPDSEDEIFGQIPLLLAVGSGHEAVVKLLLARTGVENFFRQTLLELATENEDEAMMKLLLDSGAEES